MLLKLGHGLSGHCSSKISSGGEETGGGGYDEIQINLSGGNPASNWQAVTEMLVYDDTGAEIMGSLTPKGEAASGFPDLSVGEFTSNSTYGTDSSINCLNDGSPDVSDGNSAQGVTEWSTNGSTELVFYIKPVSAILISKIEICMNVSASYAYDPAALTMDFDGVPAIFASAPSDASDYFQTTSSAIYNWFRWTF